MKWKLLNPEGANIQPRHGHRAVPVDDGILIYGGGNRGIFNHLNIYNIHQNKSMVPMSIGKINPGVAAFGMVKMNDKIVIFGGMLEYQIYTNALYALDLNTWQWNRISNAIGEPPQARIGHSFTAVDEHKIIMFGGIINVHRDPQKNLYPRFTNDLFILHVYCKNKFAWEEVITETNPVGRESHSAVVHHMQSHNKTYLIIFGGMNGERLNDLWFLDVDELIWMQFDVQGIPPEPRSLHSASLVGSQILIFGGWIYDESKFEDKENLMNYCSTNSMKILDLNAMEWKDVEINSQVPPPRAGHCSVVANNRIYILSGRSVYRFAKDIPAPCHDDIWFLEISQPAKIEKVELTCATPRTLEIKWNRVGNANCYVVEIRRVHDFTSKTIKLVTNLNQVSIAEKLKVDGAPAKKVVIINPLNKIPQVDGCDDESIINDEIKIVKTQASNIIKVSSDNSWCTVGVFKNNSCLVDGYFSFTFPPDFNDDMHPQSFMLPKIEMQTNSMYAFRVAGINSCGIGEYSKMVAFRTLNEGLPTHPNNLKFITMPNALRLCWTPSPSHENVKEYSALIGQKIGETINFAKIYSGPQPTCTVSYEILKKPEYQMKPKDKPNKSIIFRIRAINEKGAGPPLQVTYNINDEIIN